MSTLSVFPFNETNPQDLRSSQNHNIELVDGLEDVRQRVIQKLRFIFGEWFLNNQLGIPYFQDFFVRPFSVGLASALLTEQVQSVEGVISVNDIFADLDNETRIFTYNVVIVTPFGNTQIQIQNG